MIPKERLDQPQQLQILFIAAVCTGVETAYAPRHSEEFTGLKREQWLRWKVQSVDSFPAVSGQQMLVIFLLKC